MITAIIAMPPVESVKRDPERKREANEPKGESVMGIWSDKSGLVLHDITGIESVEELEKFVSAYPGAVIYGAWDFDTGEPVVKQHPDFKPGTAHLWAGEAERVYQ